MPEHTEQPQNTFVVRFWWEWRGTGAGTGQMPGWRGRIEHVQSGKGMAFHEMQQMVTFITRFISSSSAPFNDGV